MEIHFEIGDRCMLKCRHCSSMASEAGDVMKYSEQDMTRLLKSINGPKEVFLTGGEPLLYENLEALLEYLQEETEDIFTSDLLQNFSDKETAFQVHQVLHRLSEPYKEVFSLRVFGELSFGTISSLFGKSESWARVTYHRACKKIREELDHEDQL